MADTAYGLWPLVILNTGRLPIMLAGIGINAIGVLVAARRLRPPPLPVLIGQ